MSDQKKGFWTSRHMAIAERNGYNRGYKDCQSGREYNSDPPKIDLRNSEDVVSSSPTWIPVEEKTPEDGQDVWMLFGSAVALGKYDADDEAFITSNRYYMGLDPWPDFWLPAHIPAAPKPED